MLTMARLLLNAMSTVAARLLSATATFLVFALIARRWTTQEVGEFATVYACFGVVQQLPLLGLHVPFARDVGARPAQLDEAGPSAAALGLGTAVVLGLLLGLLGEWRYPATMRPAIWLVGAALLPGSLIVLAESALIAKGHVNRVATIAAAEALVRASVWAVIVLLGFGLTALFVAFAVLRVAVLIPHWSPSALQPLVRLRRARFPRAVALLRRAPTFLGILLLAAGISRLDVLMLSLMQPIDQVALYTAPYKIYEVMTMVPTALALSFFSTAVRTQGHGDRARLTAFVGQVLRLCVLAGLPLGVTIGFAAPAIVTGLFGPPFSEASVVLSLLAMVPVVVAVEQTLGQLLLIDGLERLDLRVLGAACACYTVLLTVCIPTMGYVGAAVATALTALVQLAVRFAIVRRHHSLPGVAGVVGRAVASAALMTVVMLALRPMALWIGVVVGLAAYLWGAVALGALTISELRRLRTSFQLEELA